MDEHKTKTKDPTAAERSQRRRDRRKVGKWCVQVEVDWQMVDDLERCGRISSEGTLSRKKLAKALGMFARQQAAQEAKKVVTRDAGSDQAVRK